MKTIFKTDIPVDFDEMIMEVTIESDEHNNLFNWWLIESCSIDNGITIGVSYKGFFQLKLMNVLLQF